MRLLLLILALSVPALAQRDFRNADWGMTRKQVKKTESGKPIRSEKSQLAYETDISGLKAIAVYRFLDDKLAGGAYTFTAEHDDPLDYLRDFRTLRDLLVEKYGDYTDEQVEWLDPAFQGAEADYGRAIAAGHLRMQAIWSRPDTDVALTIQGQDGKVRLVLRYDNPTLRQLEERARKQRDLNAL